MGSKPHERGVFAALALNGVPIDVLAERLTRALLGVIPGGGGRERPTVPVCATDA